MLNDIDLGPITLHMYGLMIAIGFLAAYALCSARGKRRGLDEDVIWGIFLCAMLGGMGGSRLLYYLVESPHIIADPSILWDFRNGYVVYGGIIGGVLASWFYCRHKKADFAVYFDLVMPAVALAQGFGRIGCFCAGCCYGRSTDAWYAITYTHSAIAPNGVGLVPTQLISSAGDFLFCAILLLYARKKPARGRVAALYLLLYGAGRFVIEFFRNDYRGSVGPLSTSQLISIFIVLLGAGLYRLAPRLFAGAAETAAAETPAPDEEPAASPAAEPADDTPAEADTSAPAAPAEPIPAETPAEPAAARSDSQ